MKSTTGRYSYRQVVIAITTRRRVGDVFCTASHRSITTSPKSLTSRITSRQTVKTNRQAGSMFPTLPNRTDRLFGSVSRIVIHITLYNPPSPVMCHSFHTSKMTGTHREQLLDRLRVLLFFIELNILLYMMISRHRRQQNPAPAQPASPSSPPPPRRREVRESMGHALDTAERGCYRTLSDELTTTDMPGCRNYTRMQPAFLGGLRVTNPPIRLMCSTPVCPSYTFLFLNSNSNLTGR